MTYELLQLPYKYNELEPAIDALTVEIHYSKHHATYLKNLNAALENYSQFSSWSIEKVLKNLSEIPEEIRTAVKNNGGGYFNHNIYWEGFAPRSSRTPGPKLGEAISRKFGGFDEFKVLMEKAGLTRFGSGWAWLSKDAHNDLLVHSTANQDSPLDDGLDPIIAIDVWEHAYYLKYQNKRADYLASIWDIIDWDKAEQRYLA